MEQARVISHRDDGEIPVINSDLKIGSERAGRADWVDAAKAISITLVVLWHTFGREFLANELLIYLRMPLFFFAAGFFATRSLGASWRNFVTDKPLHFAYLYVIWCVISFVLTTSADALKDGRRIPFEDLLAIPYSPPLTLWFIYVMGAVFLLARLLRFIPAPALLAFLAGVYVWSVSDGNWYEVALLDRIARLSLFFAVGCLSFPLLKVHVPRIANVWPISILAYFALAYAVYAADLDWFGPITLCASALGIGSVLSLSQWVQKFSIAKSINYVGQRTIQIYVLHRILIFYLTPVVRALNIRDDLTESSLIFVVVMPLSLAGGYLLDRAAPWLFNSPWKLSNGKKPVHALA